MDYREPDVYKGIAFASVATLHEINCAQFKSRKLLGSAYERKQAKGNLVHESDYVEQWSSIEAGTIMVDAFKVACPLRVAIDPTYFPFTYKTRDGKPTGFDVDIAIALCAQLKRRCKFVEQSWDNMIRGLRAEEYDVIISSMTITNYRLEQIDFTGKYYNTPSRIVLHKNTKFDGLESIRGKRIGVLRSSAQEKFAIAELEPAGVEVVSYGSHDRIFMDMKAAQLDGTVADQIEIINGFLSKPDGANYQLVGPELFSEKYFGTGVGVGLRKGEDDLKAELNVAITAIRDNGIYKIINDKYFAKYNLDVWGK